MSSSRTSRPVLSTRRSRNMSSRERSSIYTRQSETTATTIFDHARAAARCGVHHVRGAGNADISYRRQECGSLVSGDAVGSDILFGNSTHMTEEMQIRLSYVRTRVMTGILSIVYVATDDNPFRTSTIKYHVKSTPCVTVIGVHLREFVVLYCTGKTPLPRLRAERRATNSDSLYTSDHTECSSQRTRVWSTCKLSLWRTGKSSEQSHGNASSQFQPRRMTPDTATEKNESSFGSRWSRHTNLTRRIRMDDMACRRFVSQRPKG